MFNSLPIDFPEFEPGWVWLVGAGPGDPGLLTLNAAYALSQADVVVFDALVDERIMSLVKEGAELVPMGKRGGKPSPKQTEISQHLVELAKQNKRVLRLKGGDPFVFGRGAEEALTLVEAGVNFRVVPGVTAGVAALAYAGIPATAQTSNSAIAFVTGHSAQGDVPDSVNWTALAKSSAVIVVYMPMKHLERISKILLEAGRSADEPAAIVSKGCTIDQKVLVTTLGECAREAEKQGFAPPSLFVLGDVVTLREKLNWLGL
ncbi:MAG: uroporphyrinogen-III C-methyltransferase [Alphaproteobacteria bacterium]|nr:uroporphyrinogen-III C-methyltransferase [Rhodospirillales bacterium]MCW9045053.1 uroporphyrinogen-III C-methyltransferase [Alphaproteobacteria bacterium]